MIDLWNIFEGVAILGLILAFTFVPVLVWLEEFIQVIATWLFFLILAYMAARWAVSHLFALLIT